jgi:hypothetical protein
LRCDFFTCGEKKEDGDEVEEEEIGREETTCRGEGGVMEVVSIIFSGCCVRLLKLPLKRQHHFVKEVYNLMYCLAEWAF